MDAAHAQPGRPVCRTRRLRPARGNSKSFARVHPIFDLDPATERSRYVHGSEARHCPPLSRLDRRTHMSFFARFHSAGPNGFGYGSTAERVTEGLSLEGQTILVTGCNSGIGQETCRVLALRGALVLGTARTKEKAAAACAMFPGKAVGYACELSDPASVRGCV